MADPEDCAIYLSSLLDQLSIDLSGFHIRRSLVEMEMNELSGTEGIWDVSRTFFVIFY